MPADFGMLEALKIDRAYCRRTAPCCWLPRTNQVQYKQWISSAKLQEAEEPHKEKTFLHWPCLYLTWIWWKLADIKTLTMVTGKTVVAMSKHWRWKQMYDDNYHNHGDHILLVPASHDQNYLDHHNHDYHDDLESWSWQEQGQVAAAMIDLLVVELTVQLPPTSKLWWRWWQ